MLIRISGFLFVMFLHGASAWASDESSSHPWEPAPKPAQSWMDRHINLMKEARDAQPELLFIGDSITGNWVIEGLGKTVFDQYYSKFHAVALGTGGDRIQNVLWRVENGEVDGISPKVTVLLVGTNDLSTEASLEDIAQGIKAVVRVIHDRLPHTHLIVLGVLPFSVEAFRQKVVTLNALLANTDLGRDVRFYDIGPVLLDQTGQFRDHVVDVGLIHPTTKGYWLLAKQLNPLLMPLLQE